jgi:quinone-modifying oxidoreductase subunit QmoC
MTQPYRIEPDLDFVRDVVGSGGDTLKKCYQCATCSVVCQLAPADEPFPRKEMIHAQWGLKDKLVKDPDIWLCHNCNDCSTYCPRGAKPGDVMNALRKKAIEHYGFPQAIAKRVGDPKSLPLLIAIPAILIAVIIGLTNLWWHGEGPTRVVHGETIVLDDVLRSWELIPMWAVDVLFILTGLFAVGVFAKGLLAFWRDLDAKRTRTIGIVPAAIDVVKEIVTHSNFKECSTNQDRYLGHLGVFYGFVALFITTSCIFAGVYFLNLIVHVPLTPWPLWNPVKLLGNIGGIVLLAGLFLIIRSRLNQDEDTSASSYYDWFLLVLVTVVGASGLFAEWVRWMGIGFLYYILYYIHLVSIWALFAYTPYSKLAHLVYRTTALIHNRACGRELLTKVPVVSLTEGQGTQAG